MLPPSNSFLHQSLKLAEVNNTNKQNQETLAPPPPYSQTLSQASQTGGGGGVHVHSDTDAEGDDTLWDSPSSTPITITIDASINVHGNSNTIILASGQTSPKRPDSGSEAPSPQSATAVLQMAQKHRQTKLTEMATTIIAALQESRESCLGDDGMYPAPIEININTGVKVKGSKNVICAGGRLLHRSGSAATATAAGDTELKENGSRKRRAQSVRLILLFM